MSDLVPVGTILQDLIEMVDCGIRLHTERRVIEFESLGLRYNLHFKDSDCTVDPVTQCCTGCGVMHGDPCPECGKRGYHELCPKTRY